MKNDELMVLGLAGLAVYFILKAKGVSLASMVGSIGQTRQNYWTPQALQQYQDFLAGAPKDRDAAALYVGPLV